MQDFTGDLFTLIKKAEKYILENIHIGMRIKGMYREDIPEINKEAFREAIINAFCHRNYYLYDSVNIAIFRDSLEIRSPGLLYGGLTIEKITKERVSERRNELIADIFHMVHLIERWGRGINLILSKEPKTKFKEIGRQFITVLKRKEVKYANAPVNAPVKLSDLQKKILTLIKQNKHITYTELSATLQTHRTTIMRNIKKLKEYNLLRRIGSDKTGYWKIIKKGGN